ncbi:MAG: succinate--CoA ligase subunit alpha [Alphaproteobacteria bacterium]|nr:succinate--CoA ligase subunit alpha [Alphaproteobacteria bacterium]
MAVLVDEHTKVIVQGLTGTQASFHTPRAIKYGTNVVAGVVPNKKEKEHLGIPLFNTVQEAKDKTGATASVIFVPAKFAKDAIIEAIRAKLKLVVAITSGIPVNDMMEIRHELENSQTLLIGPNTPGIITPQVAYMGTFPDNIHRSGNIGIISRSSTLTYETVLEINRAGFGESTIVGLGDDFIIGTGFIDIIKEFNNDKQTKAIVTIGGYGGNYEIEMAHAYKNMSKKKPVIALMVDDQAYMDNNVGLASDIICRGITTAAEKKQLLESAGIIVVDNLLSLIEELSRL